MMIPEHQDLNKRPGNGPRWMLMAGMPLAIALAIYMLLAITASDCTTPHPVPTVPGWNVLCRTAEVSASIGHVTPLVTVAPNLTPPPLPVVDGGYVRTDEDGEAELTWPRYPATAACTIYAFYQTQILASEGRVVADCKEEDWQYSCHASTTLGGGGCPTVVVTSSGAVALNGTWVTIIYVKEYQLTLVIAHEGSATITPLMAQADGNPNPTKTFTVKAGDFAYTVPKEYESALGQVLDTAKFPPRGLASIDNIAPLARALVLAPELQVVNERLIELQVPHQIPPDVLNMQEIVVYGSGPDLDNAAVQKAVQLGVDWNGLGKTIPDREVLFHAQFGKAVGFAPLTVFDVFKRLGGETKIELTVILDLPGSSAIQDSLASQLAAAGFAVTFAPADITNGGELYQKNLAASANVLFITSR